MQQAFERILWSSRGVVIVAVIASVLIGIALFFVSSIDVFYLASNLLQYASPLSAEAHSKLSTEIVTQIVDVVDGYLFATIMLIFALGLYELFISKIDVAEGSEAAEHVLVIRNLDDLKERLAKLVLLILVVKFFEYAMHLHYDTTLDLLYLAIGILLISGALYLNHSRAPSH